MILKLTENAHFVGHKRNANYSYIENKISQKYTPEVLNACENQWDWNKVYNLVKSEVLMSIS